MKHSRNYAAAEFPELAEYDLDRQPSLEAQLMDAVDQIAYDAADLDDGFESHLLDLDMVREELPVFGEVYAEVERGHPQGRHQLKLNEAIRLAILDRLATDLIEATREWVITNGARTRGHPARAPGGLQDSSPAAGQESASIKSFLYRRLYDNPQIVEERDRSVEALEQLFQHYLDHPAAMPPFYARQAEREPRHRVVCDYIAGMTDDYLLRQHRARTTRRCGRDHAVGSVRFRPRNSHFARSLTPLGRPV